METSLIVTITIIAALAIILLIYWIMRYIFEKRFRNWQSAEITAWQTELEASRKTAVTRSRAVLGGRFTEQMAPYLPEFRYDPTEARFIGTPIDMIIFPGLSEGAPREIVIMEIKSGKNPQLTPVQKKLRQLVEDGMVRWEELYHRAEDASSDL